MAKLHTEPLCCDEGQAYGVLYSLGTEGTNDYAALLFECRPEHADLIELDGHYFTLEKIEHALANALALLNHPTVCQARRDRAAALAPVTEETI